MSKKGVMVSAVEPRREGFERHYRLGVTRPACAIAIGAAGQAVHFIRLQGLRRGLSHCPSKCRYPFPSLTRTAQSKS